MIDGLIIISPCHQHDRSLTAVESHHLTADPESAQILNPAKEPQQVYTNL